MGRCCDDRWKKRSVWAALLLLGAVVSGAVAQALGDPSEIILESREPNSGGVDGSPDGFGYSVGVSDGLIVVAAPFQRVVYVFRPDGAGGFTDVTLTSSDGEIGDYEFFGHSVAVSEDVIVVGAPHADDRGDFSGAVYVFRPDGAGGFTETKLTASDGMADDRFGYSVAVSDDVIVVGSPGQRLGGSGTAYVFRADGAGGFTETRLTASDGMAGDSFGWSVAASGDVVVVGSPHRDDGDDRLRAAYVFRPDGAGGFTETKLTASDAAIGDSFGWSVAVSGDVVVVGSNDVNGEDGSGAAYVFRADGAGGFTEERLAASDGMAGDDFGASVAVSGDVIVVGATGYSDLGDSPGAVYVYRPDGESGFDEAKFVAGTYCGSPVRIWRDVVLAGCAGAYSEDDTYSKPVYVVTWDIDLDGAADNADNCPVVPNPDQLDANSDGFGDACRPPTSTTEVSTTEPTTSIGASTPTILPRELPATGSSRHGQTWIVALALLSLGAGLAMVGARRRTQSSG
jgi:hypothetical protein